MLRVRSPRAPVLQDLLSQRGASVTVEGADVLLVSGTTAEAVGDLACENGIALHELTVQGASLEQAFMELTRDDVEFRSEAAA